jgi:hypothetical protein
VTAASVHPIWHKHGRWSLSNDMPMVSHTPRMRNISGASGAVLQSHHFSSARHYYASTCEMSLHEIAQKWREGINFGKQEMHGMAHSLVLPSQLHNLQQAVLVCYL